MSGQKKDWAIHLIALLTGKAWSAFIPMNYDQLKEAILKKYKINAETYRLSIRALETSQDEMPQELYVQLKDLFCNWTKVDQCSKEDLMETLMLKQYLQVLYPERDQGQRAQPNHSSRGRHAGGELHCSTQRP